MCGMGRGAAFDCGKMPRRWVALPTGITAFVIRALGLSTNYAKQSRDRFARGDALAVTARLLLRDRAKSHA